MNRKLMLFVAALALAGCQSQGASDTGDSSGPAVKITKPAAGTSVASPFEVCMEVTGAEVVPAGTMAAASGADAGPALGHLHVLVDPAADESAQITAGDALVIPKDELHLHLGDGSKCVSVTAAAGPHKLLAVFADGAHTNMNPAVTAAMDVEVTQ